MYPDYIVAEIARIGANIGTLNSAETILVWAIMLTIGFTIIGLIFRYGAESKTGGEVAVIGFGFLHIVVFAYLLILLWDCWMTNQYDALLAAYEGLI